MSFLGMDVAATRMLASHVDAWGSGVDGLIAEIVEAEALCGLSTGTVGVLSDLGVDGRAMSLVLGRAADELEGFTISIDSPLQVAEAVAAVHGFVGSENDPELDRRLAVLGGLVGAEVEDPVEAARVVQYLLAADQAGDVRFRDVAWVEAARAELARLSGLAGSGAISDNDPRIDAAYRDLRAAVGEHTPDSAVVAAIVARLVSGGDAVLDTRAAMAAELTGHDVATVGYKGQSLRELTVLENGERIVLWTGGSSHVDVVELDGAMDRKQSR